MLEMCSFRWEPDSWEIRGELSVNQIELLLSTLLVLQHRENVLSKIEIEEEQEVEPCFTKCPILHSKITVAESSSSSAFLSNSMWLKVGEGRAILSKKNSVLEGERC